MKPYVFVQLGDPQIGMGKGGAPSDGRRLMEAIRQANDMEPEFVLMSGDLTHRQQEVEYAILEDALRTCAAPLKLIPGNHDIVDANDQEGLRRYRERFGADYYRFAAGRYECVCLNSMILDAASAAVPAMRGEGEKQWLWLEGALDDALKAGRPILLHMHVPPFVDHVDEPLGYFNLPPSARERLLDLVARYGVQTLLAGHAHTTTERATDDFTLYTVSGTAVALDDRGLGFRVFRVSDDGIDQQFIQLPPHL